MIKDLLELASAVLFLLMIAFMLVLLGGVITIGCFPLAFILLAISKHEDAPAHKDAQAHDAGKSFQGVRSASKTDWTA